MVFHAEPVRRILVAVAMLALPCSSATISVDDDVSMMQFNGNITRHASLVRVNASSKLDGERVNGGPDGDHATDVQLNEFMPDGLKNVMDSLMNGSAVNNAGAATCDQVSAMLHPVVDSLNRELTMLNESATTLVSTILGSKRAMLAAMNRSLTNEDDVLATFETNATSLLKTVIKGWRRIYAAVTGAKVAIMAAVSTAGFKDNKVNETFTHVSSSIASVLEVLNATINTVDGIATSAEDVRAKQLGMFKTTLETLTFKVNEVAGGLNDTIQTLVSHAQKGVTDMFGSSCNQTLEDTLRSSLALMGETADQLTSGVSVLVDGMNEAEAELDIKAAYGRGQRGHPPVHVGFCAVILLAGVILVWN